MARVSKFFAIDSVENANKALADLPAKPKETAKLSTDDAFKKMRVTIREAQSKGYSLEEILPILKGAGIEIGLSTLKSQSAIQQKKKSTVKKEVVKKVAATEQKESVRTPAKYTEEEIARNPTEAAKNRGVR